MENKAVKPHQVTMVIHHSPCPDGDVFAMIAWLYKKRNNLEHEIKFVPAGNREKIPPDVKGEYVVVGDYSYNYETTKALIEQADGLLVIDHHVSAENELENIPDEHKIFDMKHSGAVLAWKFFFPDLPVPLFVQYIEDRDIWTKALPHTDDFASWFITLPIDFEEYEKYLDDRVLLNMISTKGTSYRELNEYLITTATNHYTIKFCWIRGEYYIVAYLNTTVLKSDIGNRAFDSYPLIDFSVAYSINDWNNTTSMSLRSTDEHVNVSKIAVSLGGGGHRNASGLTANYVTNSIGTVVESSGSIYKLIQKIYLEELQTDSGNLNVLYLNSSIHKNKLAQYFLQTKYYDKNNKEISKGMAIYNHLHNEMDEKPIDRIDVVAIWSYSGKVDTTSFCVKVNKDDPEITDSLKKRLGVDKIDYIKYKGLNKYLGQGTLFEDDSN